MQGIGLVPVETEQLTSCRLRHTCLTRTHGWVIPTWWHGFKHVWCQLRGHANSHVLIRTSWGLNYSNTQRTCCQASKVMWWCTHCNLPSTHGVACIWSKTKGHALWQHGHADTQEKRYTDRTCIVTLSKQNTLNRNRNYKLNRQTQTYSKCGHTKDTPVTRINSETYCHL